MTGPATAVQSPPQGSPRVLRLLVATVRPWRVHIVAIGIVVLASAAAEIVPPLTIRTLIDERLAFGRSDGILALGLLYLGALAAIQITAFVYSYLASWVAQRAISALRVRLFGHLLKLPVAYHDSTPLGEMISRCTADVETLETLFSSGVARLLADFTRLVTVAVAMVVLSPTLTLLAAAVLPPLVVVTRIIQVRIRNAERASRVAVGELNIELQEALGGVEVVRSFGREDHFVTRFKGALAHVVAAYNRATRYNAIYPPATVVMSALVVTLLLWAGGQTQSGFWSVSLGTLVAFVLLFQRFFAPIIALGEEWQTVQAALAGAERIAHVLALSAEEPGSRTPVDGKGSTAPLPIEVRSLVFGYGSEPVLHGISMVVRPEEHVALVGRTGAGKSTALSVIGGLYRPWAGSVAVMGRNPFDFSSGERRSLMGVVPQTVQLFAGTVIENITLGDSAVTHDRAVEAAGLTGADSFISALPMGYETPIDGAGREGGIRLSDGQRQLLSLLRALVSRPRVLLLDEATSAIDSASDQSFRAALRQVSRERGTAVLTVAHRLSTAREADRVVVMEAGRIVEEGPPDELIARGGRFAAFVQLEAAGWDWRTPMS